VWHDDRINVAVASLLIAAIAIVDGIVLIRSERARLDYVEQSKRDGADESPEQVYRRRWLYGGYRIALGVLGLLAAAWMLLLVRGVVHT